MTAPRIRPCAVIPVYDNVSTVAQVVLSAAERVERVIVVDDGSRDGSGGAARAAAARASAGRAIDVVALPVNRGKGDALVAGFRRADELGFTHAVTLDADGQHRAADIPTLLAAAGAHPRAIVLGERDMESDRIPGAARAGRRVSNFCVRRCGGLDLADTTCGLRAYPVPETLALAVRARRYAYEAEVLVRAAWAGLEVRGVPIDVWYPADRSARVSHYLAWTDSTRIAGTFLRLGIARLAASLRRGPAVRDSVPERGPAQRTGRVVGQVATAAAAGSEATSETPLAPAARGWQGFRRRMAAASSNERRAPVPTTSP